MLKEAIRFDKRHIYLNNANHAMGGFGLALVLQYYISGEPFLPVAIGWVMLVFALAVHTYSWTR